MIISELLTAKKGGNVVIKETKNTFEFDNHVKYACALSNRDSGYIVFWEARR